MEWYNDWWLIYWCGYFVCLHLNVIVIGCGDSKIIQAAAEDSSRDLTAKALVATTGLLIACLFWPVNPILATIKRAIEKQKEKS